MRATRCASLALIAAVLTCTTAFARERRTFRTPKPVITSPTTIHAVMGDSALQYVIRTNPSGATQFTAKGLPQGLTLDTMNGAITGACEEAGRFKLTVTATVGKKTLKQAVLLTVYPMVILGETVVDTVQGTPMAYFFSSNNHSPDVTFDAILLPAGLAVDDPTQGQIQGVACQAGTFEALLSASVVTPGGQTVRVERPLTINVDRLRITSPTTATAVVNDSSFLYNITVNGQATYFDARGLPDGMYVDPGSGAIFGSSSKAGTYTVTLIAENDATSVTMKMTLFCKWIWITSPKTWTIVPGDPSSYYQITAVGGSGSYTFGPVHTPPLIFPPMPSTDPPTGWPPWLVLDPISGTLYGTPTATGSWNVTVTATDLNDPTFTDSMALKITVVPQEPSITIEPPHPTGTVGEPFSFEIVVTGMEPTTIDVQGLPPWLTFDGVVVSGTPTQAGRFTLAITVANDWGQDSVNVPITINAVPFTLLSATTLSATVGEPCAYGIQYLGTEPMTLHVSGLPPGVQLFTDPRMAFLAGRITQPGEYVVRITGTNFEGTRTAALVIDANGPLPITAGKFVFDTTQPNHDSLTLSGIVAVSDGSMYEYHAVVLTLSDLGGPDVRQSFILDEHGRGEARGFPTATIALSKPKNCIAGFTFSISHAQLYAPLLIDSLFAPETWPQWVFLPATLTFNNYQYEVTVPFWCTERHGVITGVYAPSRIKPHKSFP